LHSATLLLIAISANFNGEKIMKNTMNSLLAISAAAMLAACGGGGGSSGGSGDGSNTANPNPAAPSSAQAHASPGVFVASGQTSASFNLVNCQFRSFSGSGFIPLNPSTATLRIDANGDMTFSHAGQSSPLVPAVSETIVASTASEAAVEVSSNARVAEYYYDASLEDDRTSRSMSLRYYPDPGSVRKFVQINLDGDEYECNFDPAIRLTANFGDYNARIAAITSGITTTNQSVPVSSISPQAGFASPLANWQNETSSASNRIQLAIDTGVVSASTQGNTAYTPIDLAQALDLANAANEPNYRERRFLDRSGRPIKQVSFSDNRSGYQNFNFQVYSGTDLIPFFSY
jgi:hypothetical protein